MPNIQDRRRIAISLGKVVPVMLWRGVSLGMGRGSSSSFMTSLKPPGLEWAMFLLAGVMT